MLVILRLLVFFFHDHATIYVEDSALQSNVNSAIDKWNAALGADVFSIGSKSNSTLTVGFGDGTAAGWDGLFNGTSVQVDQTHFNDQSYVSANTLSPAFQQKIKHFLIKPANFLQIRMQS